MRGATDTPPSPALTHALLALVADVRQELGSALIDAAIGYNTVLLIIDFTKVQRAQLLSWLSGRELSPPGSTPDVAVKPDITLPVYYHPEVGPDLESLSQSTGLSTTEVIQLHCSRCYFAYATGFAPGFCYLGNLDARLQYPRLSTPRPKVAAGSVAIAEQQTAVYPRSSPGGWHILGRCPTPLFDLTQEPPGTLQIGHWVQFTPISRQEFLKLGGLL